MSIRIIILKASAQVVMCVIGASLSKPHTSVLMQKFGICMYVCMYIVVVSPAVNSNFAYYAIRMRSALRHYVCGISRMEATGSL